MSLNLRAKWIYALIKLKLFIQFGMENEHFLEIFMKDIIYDQPYIFKIRCRKIICLEYSSSAYKLCQFGEVKQLVTS